jgi:hypothetical protein
MVSGMCLDRTGRYIYCAGYQDSLVLVLDTWADSVVTSVQTSVWAAARDPLAANRRTNRIYEAGYGIGYGQGIPVLRDSIPTGIEELKPVARISGIGSTMVGRSGPLRVEAVSEVYDASGSMVTVLRSGANDIGHLPLGVYFCRERLAGKTTRITIVR